MTGILFDLDGTLIESISDLVTAVNKTMAHYGYRERTREEVRMAIGSGVRRLIGDLLPELEEDALSEVIETYRGYYADCCQEQTKPYDGIVEALQQLQKKDWYLKKLSRKGYVLTHVLLPISQQLLRR